MSLQRACLLVMCAIAWIAVAPRASAAESCTVTVTGVNFGLYDPASPTPLNGMGSMTVACTGNPIPVTVSLSAGSSGSYAGRRMSNGTDAMYYNLYLDPARTIVFGDGTGGTQSSTCTTGVASSGIGCTGSNPAGSGRQFVRPIHGQINASQNVGVGLYSDTIFYTVTF